MVVVFRRRVKARLVCAFGPDREDRLLNDLSPHTRLDQLVFLMMEHPTDLRLEIFFALYPEIHIAVHEALQKRGD